MVEEGEMRVEEFVELCSEAGEWWGLIEGRVGLGRWGRRVDNIFAKSIIYGCKSIIKFETE